MTTVLLDNFTGAAGGIVGRTVSGQTWANIAGAPPNPADGGFELDGAGALFCKDRISPFYVAGSLQIPVPALTGSIIASSEADIQINSPTVPSKISFDWINGAAASMFFSLDMVGDGSCDMEWVGGIIHSAVAPSQMKIRVEVDPANLARLFVDDVYIGSNAVAYGGFTGASYLALHGYQAGAPSGYKLRNFRVDTGLYVPGPAAAFWTDFVSTREEV